MLNVLKSMPTRGKVILGASVVVTLVVVFMLFRMATAPSYETIASGIKPGQTGKVTAALDEAGIPYELTNNGTAVEVPQAQASQANVALATAGVDTGAGTQPGFELLDKQKLGSSDFQQKVNYQRALEGEVANNIGGIAGVNSATVQLSLPEDQLFADESKPATAAVLLDANDMDPAQIKGIAKLVSGSVEGLKEEDVTITAANGELLWPVGENGQPGSGATTKLSAENRYAAQVEGKLNAKLTQMLGADKAYVQVSPTLNMDDTSRDTLTWGDKGTALTSKSEKEELQSQGEAATPSGVRAQLEDTGAQGAGSESNYNRESKEDSFGVDKKVERTKVAQGAVEKLDVAVVFDKSVPKPDVSEMEAYVANAAGIDEQRGDSLSVSQVAFAKPAQPEEAKGGPVPEAAAGAAKWVGLGIAALIFLFFVTRALRKRESEALGDARWLTEIDEPRPLAELTAAGEMGGGLPAAPSASAARQQVGEMVDKEPEKVAQQLRAWMSEES